MLFTHAAVAKDEITVARSPTDCVRVVGVESHGVTVRDGAVVCGRKKRDLEVR